MASLNSMRENHKLLTKTAGIYLTTCVITGVLKAMGKFKDTPEENIVKCILQNLQKPKGV